MPVETVINLVDALRQFRLLEAEQLDEVIGTLTVRFPEPKALAKDLLQRGWLTPFQVNQIFLGRGQELVLGRYVLLDRLGEGGMGQVFRARQTSTGRVVALKVIRKDRLRSEQAARRFEREIHAAAKLHHANVVQAIDADHVGDTHFFAMEYVEGIDLGKFVKSRGTVGVKEACDYIRQAALGLQHAFEHGLIHRDIKPANLLLTTKEQIVKILDMGLVREEHGAASEDSGALTHENVVMGTPDYLAPEQARDAHNVDIRADLYSLGCTLYYLLAGRVPFPGGQLGEKLIKHQLEQATPLRQLRPDVPAEVEDVVVKLMAKKAEDRHQTPAELAEALACLLSGERPMSAPRSMATKAADDKQPCLAGPAPARPPGSNPFVDLGGGDDTLPSADTSPPSHKIPKPEVPSLPFTVRMWALANKSKTLTLAAWERAVILATPQAEKIGIPRDKVRLVLLAAIGLILFLIVGCWTLSRFAPRELSQDKPAPGPPGIAKLVSWPRTNLDALDATLIAEIERFDWLPRETVAVVGEQRGRHPGGMNRLVLSPDGKVLASAGLDFTIRLWNPSTLRNFAILKGHTGTIHSLAFKDSSLLVSGSADKTIRLWHLNLPEARAGPVLKEHDAAVWSVVLSGDGKRLVSGGADKRVILWELVGGAPLKNKQFAGFKEEVRALALAPDGNLLVVGDGNTLRTWDLASVEAREKSPVILTSTKLHSLTFSKTGKKLLAGASGVVHYFTVDGELTEACMPVSAGGVVAGLAFPQTMDEMTFAAAGDHITVYKWSLGQANTVRRMDTLAPAAGLDWLSGGTYLVSGHGCGSILTWDIKAPFKKSKTASFFPLIGHPAETVAMALSADGKRLATSGGDLDSRVLLWSLEGPKPTLLQEIATEKIHALAFSPDGHFLAGCGMANPYVLVWDLPQNDFKNPTTLRGYNRKAHAKGVRSVAFSPDGRFLVSGGYGEMCTWDLRNGLPRDPEDVQAKHKDSWITALTFRPDGKWLAAGGADGQITLWELVRSLPPHFKSALGKTHAGGVTSLAFDPDNKTLVSGGQDKSVRCWDLKTHGEYKDRFPGHKRAISSVAFSPQGHRFVSADRGGLVIAWDMLATGSTTWQLETPVTAVAFAHDGRHLALATGSSAVFVVRLQNATQ